MIDIGAQFIPTEQKHCWNVPHGPHWTIHIGINVADSLSVGVVFIWGRAKRDKYGSLISLQSLPLEVDVLLQLVVLHFTAQQRNPSSQNVVKTIDKVHTKNKIRRSCKNSLGFREKLRIRLEPSLSALRIYQHLNFSLPMSTTFLRHRRVHRYSRMQSCLERTLSTKTTALKYGGSFLTTERNTSSLIWSVFTFRLQLIFQFNRLVGTRSVLC